MNAQNVPSDDAVTRGMDSLHVLICRAQRDLFLLIAEADRRRLWEGDGAPPVSWGYCDGARRCGLQAELLSARGAVGARALERGAGELPVMPGEGGAWPAGAGRAAPLVAPPSARLSADPDPERATI